MKVRDVSNVSKILGPEVGKPNLVNTPFDSGPQTAKAMLPPGVCE